MIKFFRQFEMWILVKDPHGKNKGRIDNRVQNSEKERVRFDVGDMSSFRKTAQMAMSFLLEYKSILFK